jgi:hypothetical protein
MIEDMTWGISLSGVYQQRCVCFGLVQKRQESMQNEIWTRFVVWVLPNPAFISFVVGGSFQYGLCDPMVRAAREKGLVKFMVS